MHAQALLNRRFRFCLLTVLAVLGAAHASVQHLPVSMTPAALLTPSAATLQAACDMAITAALAGQAPPTHLDGVPTRFTWAADPASPTVTLSTPASSMANRCASAVMESRAIEAARRAPHGRLWVTVRGRTQTPLRQESQGWHVALSVQDAAGHELARVIPTVVAAGRAGLWTQTCTDLDCRWTGENRYGFDLAQLSADVQAAVGHAARVVLDVDCPVPELMATRP